MTKTEQYAKLHIKLAKEYNTTPEVVKCIRSSVARGLSILEMIDAVERKTEIYKKLKKSGLPEDQELIINDQTQKKTNILRFLYTVKAVDLDLMIKTDL